MAVIETVIDNDRVPMWEKMPNAHSGSLVSLSQELKLGPHNTSILPPSYIPSSLLTFYFFFLNNTSLNCPGFQVFLQSRQTSTLWSFSLSLGSNWDYSFYHLARLALLFYMQTGNNWQSSRNMMVCIFHRCPRIAVWGMSSEDLCGKQEALRLL